jgi:transcriptional regulator with XRE-family HTH domain
MPMTDTSNAERQLLGIRPDLGADFGQRARALREAAGIKQESAASRMRKLGHTGWRQTTLSKVESGQRPVSLDEAYCLALVLGAHLRDFLEHGPGELQRGYDIAVTRLTTLDQVSDQLAKMRRDAEQAALQAMAAVESAAKEQ